MRFLIIIVAGRRAFDDIAGEGVQVCLCRLVLRGVEVVLCDGGFVQVIGLHAQARDDAQAVAVAIRAAQVEVLYQRPDAMPFCRGRVFRNPVNWLLSSLMPL